MRRLLVLALLLLPCVFAGPACAEGYEETEHRLKSAGIDAEMRVKIHAAIRRAVERLRAQQWKRGNFPGPAGQTALAGLALRHAAIPDGVEGSRQAIAWMRKYASKELRERTYEAGIVSMLLQADGTHRKYLHSIHDRLSKGPKSDRGYWGYRSAGGDPTPNLSTAQFAALGLWAAERTEAPTAKRAWSDHLEALLLAQQSDGSWGYYAATDPVHGAKARTVSTYATGTFMGLANLILASNALRDALEAEPEELAAVLVARGKALAALRRHAQWTLGAPRMSGVLGTFPLYRLYALEKACIFADLEDVGGIPWYREGAQWLLDTQEKDGGWLGLTARNARGAGTAHTMSQDTSFALLFLLRTSASYHPITPRPVDGAPVTTPRAEDPAESGPTSGAGPTLEPAHAALDTVEKGLEKKRLTALAPLRDAFRFIGRTYRLSLRDGEFVSARHEAWCRRAETLLLDASTRFQRAAANDRLLWQALAFHALDTLAVTHRRVGPPLMKRVLDMEHDTTFRADYRFGWYGAAMDALRRLDAPSLAGWLGDRALHADPKLWARTSTALTALGGMAVRMPGSRRYGATRAILTHLVPVLRRSQGNRETRALLRDIGVAVHRLAAGSGGDVPWLEEVVNGGDGKALLTWWARHDDPTDEVWSD